MKKRIVKFTALLFATALLTLPGKAFFFRQTVPGVSAYNAAASVTCDGPISDDLAESCRN